MTSTITPPPPARRVHRGRAERGHGIDDVIQVNGAAVIHDGDVWVWAQTGTALGFDQCERYGLDGSGRRYGTGSRHDARA